MPDIKFASLEAFWHMEGHGVYVWSAMAIAVVLMGVMVLYPLWSHRQQLKRLARQQRRRTQQAERHARPTHSPES